MPAWTWLVVCLAGCAHVAPGPVTPRAMRLLAMTAEHETSTIPQRASQYEADTEQERTPRVVAVGETPFMSADDAMVVLAGDEAGTVGFSVDNCVVIEVLSVDGRRLGRAVVGFVNGLAEGGDHLDLLGRQSFSFEPREINLASILPERGTFRLRATVLDIGGVGRVSDVFVLILPRPPPGG